MNVHHDRTPQESDDVISTMYTLLTGILAREIAMEGMIQALIATHPDLAALREKFQQANAAKEDSLRDTGFDAELPYQAPAILSYKALVYVNKYLLDIEAHAARR